MNSTLWHPVSLRSVLILSSHLCLSYSKWFLPFRVSNDSVVCISHPPWLNHPNSIWWKVQVVKLQILQPSPASHYFLPLGSKYSPPHSYQTPSVCVLPLGMETKFHTNAKQQIKLPSCHVNSRYIDGLFNVTSTAEVIYYKMKAENYCRWWTGHNVNACQCFVLSDLFLSYCWYTWFIVVSNFHFFPIVAGAFVHVVRYLLPT